MKPHFEVMTIAELRAYCALVRKVGMKAYGEFSDILKVWDGNESLHHTVSEETQALVADIKQTLQQMQALGLEAHRFK